MELNKIHLGDCLELSNEIPDSSVDLILTDLPYGNMKGIRMNGWGHKVTQWDVAINPKDIHEIANRVLRKNGKMVLFSQEPYTSRLITEQIPNVSFSYRMIWEKDHFANGLSAKKAPVSYFEDILVFSKTHDYTEVDSNPLKLLLRTYVQEYGKDEVIKLFEEEGRYKNKQTARTQASYMMGISNGRRLDLMDEKMYDFLNSYIKFKESYEEMCLMYFRYNPLRKYFSDVLNFIGKKYNGVKEDLGHRRAEHVFYFKTSQFRLCTEEVYNELIEYYDIDKMPNFLPYSSLKDMNDKFMKKTFPSVFNLWEGKKHKSNILKYKKDYGGFHPTQKPVLLLEDLIKTFSNEGDTVLDLTCGSGSTCVAALNTGRFFIGMEKDEEYFNIATERVESHVAQADLFDYVSN